MRVHASHRGAVCREDYAEAARLRDLLRQTQLSDPLFASKIALAISVAEEDYKVSKSACLRACSDVH